MKKWTGVVIVVLFAIAPVLLIITTQIQYSHIDESETKVVVAHYLGVEKRGYRSQYLILHFSDYESLKVSWNCSVVAENIKQVKPNEELVIQIHPHKANIMSIHSGDRTILDFAETSEKMDKERDAFLIIGLAIYFLYVVLFFLSSEGQKMIKGHKKRR